MEKLQSLFATITNVIIYSCSVIGTLAGILSVTKCLTKDDYRGLIKSALMALLGVSLILGYPSLVDTIRTLLK